MKRIIFIILALILLTLAACSNQQNEPAQTSAVPEPSATPTATPTQTPEPIEVTIMPSETPAPANLSLTTGLTYEGKYQPVLVVIENAPEARPQKGLQTADIVYEVPVEGGITRFVCVFSDNVPNEVMPVRSGRIPFLYIQHEWDAILMHYGGAGSGPGEKHATYSFYGHPLYEKVKFDVDGFHSTWSDYYYRVSGIGAPHNVMGNPQLAQQLYNYEPEPIHWIFSTDVAYQGEAVNEIKLELCSNVKNFISYTYDPEKDLYLRFMGGKPFISAETENQVTVKNIIVQYSTYKVSSGRKLWAMTGSGKADYYIGGKVIHGSWERKTEDDDTMYLDDKGNQIVLKPGNTWIHLSPEK